MVANESKLKCLPPAIADERSALSLIANIAAGSATADSLPHIAAIAKAALDENTCQPQPKNLGGRPKNTPRDVAIFLAKTWRMGDHKESSTVAYKWIINKWQDVDRDAIAARTRSNAKGIKEDSHIRAAIKRARKRGLESAMVRRDFAPTGAVLLSAVELKKDGRDFVLHEGARAWVWSPDAKPFVTEALEFQVKNLQISEVEEPAG
jgi:hypothetical protein